MRGTPTVLGGHPTRRRLFLWPMWPLARHARLGQNVIGGAMLVLRVALGNVPRGGGLAPGCLTRAPHHGYVGSYLFSVLLVFSGYHISDKICDRLCVSV
jgi:hypothetical protein